MKNSHERLEKLINYFSNNKTGGLLIPSRETFKTMFQDETMNIRRYLQGKSLAIKNERGLKFLVEQYQAQIAVWLDELIHPIHQKNKEFPNWALDFMVKELEKLLSFIYTRYETFFNLDARVPQISLKHFRELFKANLPKIRNHLMAACNNEALVKLALMPLERLVDCERKTKFTYRQLFYSTKVEKALSGFNNEKYTGSHWEHKALVELLVWNNYNNLETADFIVNHIIAVAETDDNDQDKLTRLRFFLKEFNQFKEQPNMAFEKHPSLRKQVIDWIAAEIKFITPAVLPVPTTPIIPGTNSLNETKIKLNLPVGVIALLGRAAKDLNLIPDKSNKEIFTEFAETFTSKNTEKLSVTSLIRKSYPTESRSKEEAIDLLHEVIKRIHRY